MLIIVTLVIVIGLVIALVKWWRGHEGSKEIKNMVKLLQIKDHMTYFFPHTTLTENKASHQAREPVTPTAPLDNGMPRRRSLGLPPDAELVNPETQVQVHSLPRALQPAPRHNPVDEEESAAPSHHKLQKDGEPVQTLLRLRGLLVAVGQCNTQVRLSLIYVPGQPPRPPVPGIL